MTIGTRLGPASRDATRSVFAKPDFTYENTAQNASTESLWFSGDRKRGGRVDSGAPDVFEPTPAT